jgi:hypothetical protein
VVAHHPLVCWLGISVHTAKFHVASLDRLDAVRRTDPVAHAYLGTPSPGPQAAPAPGHRWWVFAFEIHPEQSEHSWSAPLLVSRLQGIAQGFYLPLFVGR